MKLLNCHIIVAILVLTSLPTIICAVNGYHWHSDFGPISPEQHITHRTDTPEGSATITLDVNTTQGATITANHSTDAQLHSTRTNDTLVTEYRLSFSGNGITATGGSDTSYEPYNTFLSTAAVITYKTGYNTVDVTLHVRASNTNGKLADSGEYTATQTLTVAW